ncbi:MAG: 30S ribosomal protein S12 methylthiotransferase RimO [Deltaproteobacteria bacterium]|nr:MAG: 30S ribosomal protein S12 methylthiotransferase RimO [Deltaproteobacteria bacterium]
MKKVGLISLGCVKNRVDAERILGGFEARGFEIADDPADAEILFVNTCGFIKDAVEEAVEEILEATLHKKSGKCKILAVSGCLVKRYPEMRDELPEVDLFFTPEDVEHIPEIVSGVPQPLKPRDYPARILTAPPHSVYLKIAEGCSNRCSYCTIPTIRGDFRSVPIDKLIEEARWLAGEGAVELNVVAQDVTSYGLDGDGPRLAELLSRLEEIDSLRWIRLLYAYPRPLDDRLMELLSSGGKVIPYIDAPIQHAHPRVLKAMGRKVSAAETSEFFRRLKKHVPGIVLRTTAIVGFPGESEKEFQALLDFVEETRFNHLGAFAYSPEEGTPAAELAGRLDEEVIWERYDRLMTLQAVISEEKNAAFVGRELPILVEGIDGEGEVVGRSYGQAPEVDGHTILEGYGDRVVEVGEFVTAKITASSTYDLIASVTAYDDE